MVYTFPHLKYWNVSSMLETIGTWLAVSMAAPSQPEINKMEYRNEHD